MDKICIFTFVLICILASTTFPDQPSNLLSGNYPFYRVYSFSTWEDNNTKSPHAHKLVKYILQQTEHLDRKFNIIPASALREAGWKFRDTELVGEPAK